jgi:hypothetical protein
VRRILPFLRKGMFACKMDLFHGYHHLRVRQEDQDLLGFEWKGRFYKFTVLPFGLASSPRTFTKVVQAMVERWRAKGILVFFYIDDFLFLGNSKQELEQMMKVVREDLEKLGWIVKAEKSVLSPVQLVEFLGVEIDLLKGVIRVPKSKGDDLIQFMDSMIKASKSGNRVRRRTLAQLNGKMTFASLACWWLKACQHKLNALLSASSGKSWDRKLHVPSPVVQDLLQAKRALVERNEATFESSIAWTTVTVDASSAGFGAVIQDKAFVGKWSPQELQDHINAKEISTLLKILDADPERFRNAQLHVYVDNTVALSYFRKAGGRKEQLHSIMQQIMDHCWQLNVSIRRVTYIPSAENVEADRLSRMSSANRSSSPTPTPTPSPAELGSCAPAEFLAVQRALREINKDVDREIAKNEALQDWGLSKEGLDLLQKTFGVALVVDRFATRDNAKLPRFCTRAQLPENREADALLQDWTTTEGNYACPPLGLIEQVVAFIMRSRATATLVVPEWTGKLWWPFLYRMTMKRCEVPLHLIVRKTGAEISRNSSWRFVALQINGGSWKHFSDLHAGSSSASSPRAQEERTSDCGTVFENSAQASA